MVVLMVIVMEVVMVIEMDNWKVVVMELAMEIEMDVVTVIDLATLMAHWKVVLMEFVKVFPHLILYLVLHSLMVLMRYWDWRRYLVVH